MFVVFIVDFILYGKLDVVKVFVSDFISGRVKIILEEFEVISDFVKFK